MLNWIRYRFEELRRKGARDKGFVLVSTIMLFVMVSGTAYAMIATANRTVDSAVQSADFVQSGQLADLAVQDAVHELNEVRPAALPSSSAPRTGGTANDGSWSWYADPVTSGAGGKTAVIHATGTFRTATRKVQATAQGVQVGGFKVESDASISYQMSPSAAFSHTVSGRSVTVVSGVSGRDPFITGSVGVLGSVLDVAGYPGPGSPKMDVDYYQYGAQANSRALPSSVRAPAGMSLDPQFIKDAMVACGGAVPQPWKASDHGGVLRANGNVGCYSSMDFNEPTHIEGDGAFNAYVSGGVIIRKNISAAAGTGLNIYTNGNVVMPTEEAGETALTLQNLFIYAPQGLCETLTPTAPGGYRSLTTPLDYNGSLACKTVRAAGSFTHVHPIDPAGDDIFNNEVWYLADYKRPAGERATP